MEGEHADVGSQVLLMNESTRIGRRNTIEESRVGKRVVACFTKSLDLVQSTETSLRVTDKM